MKILSKIALLSFLMALFIGGSSKAHASGQGLQKLIGVFQSGGQKFTIYRSGHLVSIRTNAELTRLSECRTHLGPELARDVDDDGDYAEVYYKLDVGDCTGVDGHVTLHYNRALTGVDVYLIDVVIRRGSSIGTRHDGGYTTRWSLTKVSGL